MSTTEKKSAVTARQSARSRAAEKMAERKKREKQISDKLEEFIGSGLLIEDAEKQRDEAIAKANDVCAAATATARSLQVKHALGLKKLDLTDREIAELTDLPVSAVREMIKEAKKSAENENSTDTVDSSGNTGTDSAGSSVSETTPPAPAVESDSVIAS